MQIFIKIDREKNQAFFHLKQAIIVSGSDCTIEGTFSPKFEVKPVCFHPPCRQAPGDEGKEAPILGISWVQHV